MQETEELIKIEREKAKTCQANASRLHNIAHRALSILERPLETDQFFFDNLGEKEYPTQKVNIADVIDLGMRYDPSEQNVPLPPPQRSICHIKWQEPKNRIPKP